MSPEVDDHLEWLHRRLGASISDPRLPKFILEFLHYSASANLPISQNTRRKFTINQIAVLIKSCSCPAFGDLPHCSGSYVAIRPTLTSVEPEHGLHGSTAGQAEHTKSQARAASSTV